MKKIIIVFCLLYFCVLGVQAQNAELDKMGNMLEQAADRINNGDFNKAIDLIENVLPKIEKQFGQNEKEYMSVCNGLNLCYLLAFEMNKAEKSCRDNYKRCYKYRKEYPKNFVQATELLGRYYLMTGNISKSDKLFKNLSELYPNNFYYRARYLSSLANISQLKGNYTKAEQFLKEALQIYEKISYQDKSEYIITLSNLGCIYAALGLYSEAEIYYVKVVNLAKKISYVFLKQGITGNTLLNLAVAYAEQKKYAKAENILLKQLTDVHDTKIEIRKLYLLGAINLFKHKFIKAEEYLLQAKGLCKETKIKDEVYYSILSDLAVLKIILGEYDESEKLYLNNLKSVRKKYGKNNTVYIRTLAQLTYLYSKNKKNKKAFSYFKKLINRIMNLVINNFVSLTEQEKFQCLQQLNYSSNGFQNIVLKNHTTHPSMTTDLFNFLLLRKKLILNNTIKIKRIIENSENATIKSRYKELQNTKYLIADKNTPADTLPVLQKKVEKLQKNILLQLYKEYPNNDFDKFPNFAKIKNNISDDEAIIEFTNFNKSDTTFYCAIIVKKNLKYPKLIYLCTQQDIENALSKENPNTNTAQHIKNIYHNSNKLYKYLFEKIEAHLKNIEIVNISPSGLVHNVAFSCLKNNAGKYLKDKYLIKYNVNFADLCSSKKNITINSQNTHKVVLFGNMKYDLNSEEVKKIEQKNLARGINSSSFFENTSLELSPLPATKQEVDSIANIFSKNNISCTKYTGTEANENNFYKLDTSHTDILHIATHGFYFANEKKQRQLLPTMPNLNPIDNSYFKNGLFFSGAANSLKNDASMTKISDGILSAYEICNLNLANVKLVVLSACLTGVGDIKQNEGVIGLSRAFKIAGAKYLLISLWEIPSCQTTEFMINFYKNIMSSISIEQAFRKAQQKMSEKYQNPYFWGGFILIK